MLRVSSPSNVTATPHGIHALFVPDDSKLEALATTTSLLTQQALVRYLTCHRPAANSDALDRKQTIELRRQWEHQ